MKRFLLSVFLVASLMAVSPTMDPPPGEVIGQKKSITNNTDGDITISGTTGIRLGTPITLGAGKSLELIWDGSNWVLLGTKGRFSNSTFFGYDFAQLDVSAVFGLPCIETVPVTVTGAAFNDSCDMTSNLGQDGGTALNNLVDLTCRATTNAAIGKACLRASTDGGIVRDLPDAGYTVRVTR